MNLRLCLKSVALLVFCLLPLVCVHQAKAQYRAVVSDVDALPQITLRERSGDRTEDFQNAVDAASARRSRIGGERVRGARIVVRPGTYNIEGTVQLKSNVYIRFSSGVVIERQTSSQRISTTFEMRNGVSNISVRGPSPDDRVRFTAPVGSGEETLFWRGFGCHDVVNFEIANIDFEEDETAFSSIICSIEDSRFATAESPRRGSFRDLSTFGAAAGFGLVQVHSGERLRFDDVFSEGGCTLRLETGIESLRGIRNLRARNVENVRGRAGVLFSPHAVRNHRGVDIRGVRSFGTTFAIEIGRGFVDRDSASKGFTRNGRFRDVTIRDVVADFESRRGRRLVTDAAQIVPAYFGLIPPSLLSSVTETFSGEDALVGPAIGAVMDEMTYSVDLPDEEIELLNFDDQPDKVVNPLDDDFQRISDGEIRDLRRFFFENR